MGDYRLQIYKRELSRDENGTQALGTTIHSHIFLFKIGIPIFSLILRSVSIYFKFLRVN